MAPGVRILRLEAATGFVEFASLAVSKQEPAAPSASGAGFVGSLLSMGVAVPAATVGTIATAKENRPRQLGSLTGLRASSPRFWKLFKYSVRSTHIHLSREKLPLYLAEFCYRSNHREMGNLMFDALLARL